MTKYVIHKSSRVPDFQRGSYSGSTWERAGIPDRFQQFYTDLNEADQICRILNRSNPVGFRPTMVPES